MKTVTACTYDYKTVDEIMKIEKLDSYPVGLEKIDKEFGFPTGFYLLTGVAGSSKTFFATWLCKQMWQNNNIKSVFFSLEMTEQKLRQRILQQWSDLTMTEFAQGKSVKKAVDMLHEGAIAIMELEKKEQTIDFVGEKIREASDYGYSFIIFDHLHELTGMNDDRNKLEADRWATFWAKTAKEYPHMHFMVLSQPSKQSFKQKFLTQDSLKGSNVFCEKADYFLSINRVQREEGDDIFSEDREVVLWLDKTRNTDKNHVGFKVFFDYTGNYVDYVNLARK